MNKETRVQNIEKTMKLGSFAQKELMWGDALEVMQVYKIPLKDLIYNKYNGRILSKTKSLEAQNKELNPEDAKDRKIIEKLLWDSKPDRNRKTEQDIRANAVSYTHLTLPTIHLV